MCVNRNDSASSFDNFDLLCFEVLILMVPSRGKLKCNLSCHCATVPLCANAHAQSRQFTRCLSNCKRFSHSVSKEKSIRDRLKIDMLEGIDSYVTRRDNFVLTRPQALEGVQGQMINKT